MQKGLFDDDELDDDSDEESHRPKVKWDADVKDHMRKSNAGGLNKQGTSVAGARPSKVQMASAQNPMA